MTQLAFTFYLLTFSVLLLLPGAQMLFTLVPEQTLFGAEMRPELPTLSGAALQTGDYQTALERWFSKQLGFRGHLVKSNNQLDYSLFRQISSSHHTQVVIGEDNYLFEKTYIDDLNRLRLVSDEMIDGVALGLKRLQNGLQARGVVFLLVVSPNKAATYVEKLPSEFRFEKRWDAPSNRERFLAALFKHGVNFVDGQATVEALKRENAANVFPKAGTHWSYQTACVVDQQIIKKLELLLARPLTQLDCTPSEQEKLPRGTDKDLAEIANLWDPTAFYDKLSFYPKRQQPDPSAVLRPKMLFVGSSFIWPLLQHMDQAYVYSHRDIYYYYQSNTVFELVDRHGKLDSRQIPAVPINKAGIDWNKDVFAKDVIVIETNVSAIEHTSHGFLADAVVRLEAGSPE